MSIITSMVWNTTLALEPLSSPEKCYVYRSMTVSPYLHVGCICGRHNWQAGMWPGPACVKSYLSVYR